jgi:hypothetical protein
MKNDPKAKVPAGNQCPPIKTRPSNGATVPAVLERRLSQLGPSID